MHISSDSKAEEWRRSIEEERQFKQSSGVGSRNHSQSGRTLCLGHNPLHFEVELHSAGVFG